MIKIKKLLMRPGALLLPLVLLLGAWLGKHVEVSSLLLGGQMLDGQYVPESLSLVQNAAAPLMLGGWAALPQPGLIAMLSSLLMSFLGVKLCTLAAAESFRNACASEPSPRGVDKLFVSALIQSIIGIAIALALVLCLGIYRSPIYFLTAVLLNIEHLFVERTYALGRSVDGLLSQFVSALLIACGLMLEIIPLTLAAAGACAVSGITSFILNKSKARHVSMKALRFAPRAMLQSLTYPALAIALALLTMREALLYALPPALLALMPYQLSRTPCRRSADESRKLNLLLSTWTATTLALTFCLRILPMEYASFAMLSYLCSSLTYLKLTPRPLIAMAALLAAFALNLLLPLSLITQALTIALCLLAILVSSHKAFLRKV